jgi:hypothetical protein
MLKDKGIIFYEGNEFALPVNLIHYPAKSYFIYKKKERHVVSAPS